MESSKLQSTFLSLAFILKFLGLSAVKNLGARLEFFFVCGFCFLLFASFELLDLISLIRGN